MPHRPRRARRGAEDHDAVVRTTRPSSAPRRCRRRPRPARDRRAPRGWVSLAVVVGSLGCLAGVLSSGVAGLLDAPDSASGDGTTRWALADAAAESAIRTWSPGVSYGRQAKLDEQMLIVHATAAAADHHGPSRRDDRIAPLVEALTRDRWVGTLDGRTVDSPTKTDFTCAPGWSASRRAVRMHPSTTGLVATALAAAWRVRDRVELPAVLSRRIQRQLVRVARSACWRFPSRGLAGINQINWSADVQAAAAAVSARPRPFWDAYRAQLTWFLGHARTAPVAGGSPVFSSGFGFHYEARSPATDTVNAADTVEYSNIVFSALAHYDDAVRDGMTPLPAAAATRLRGWAAHLLYGTWTPSGYLNWDSGKREARLHSTQYWLYAAQGFVSGLVGSRTLRLLPDQLAVAADVRRRVIGLFQHRAENAGTFDLPGTSYGLSSPQMGGPNDRKAIIGARFAELVGGFRGLDRISASKRRPGEGFSDDRELGRTAVATRRYSTAVVRTPGRSAEGGLEPARILDARAYPVTGVGGRGAGTLGLVLADGGSRLIDTQDDVAGQRRSNTRIAPSLADRSGPWRGSLTLSGTADAPGVRVAVSHRFLADRIVTTYRIRNDRGRGLLATLRIPTYASPAGERLAHRQRHGQAPVRWGDDAVLLRVGGIDGARFTVQVDGLPGPGRLERRPVAPQRLNPRPGPQLTVGFVAPRGATVVRRTIVVRAAPEVPVG